MTIFGDLLSSFRKEKGLTQEALGSQCVPPFTRNYIFLLESGRRLPPPEESVLAIAKALSLSKEKTKSLLEAAKSERYTQRVSLAIRNNNDSKLEVESFVRCLEDNLTQEEVINLGKRLLKSTTATK